MVAPFRMKRWTAQVALGWMLAAGGGAGCEPDAVGDQGSTSATDTASPSPSGGEPPGDASASPSASASAPGDDPPGAASVDEGPDPGDAWPCGEKGEPDCPMQAWMKKVIHPASRKRDLPAVAAAYRVIAAHPIEGFDQWVELSNKGAKAADEGDQRAAKDVCNECHDLYKKPYLAERRDQAWGP